MKNSNPNSCEDLKSPINKPFSNIPYKKKEKKDKPIDPKKVFVGYKKPKNIKK